MVDADGNTATITYSGTNIQSITDGAGRVTTFTYDSYNNMSRLTQVTDPSGRISALTYDGGNLQKVTYPDGTSVQFQYTTVTANGKQYNLISRATDKDGTYLTYTYKTSGMAQEYAKVTSVQEYAADGFTGNGMTVTYIGTFLESSTSAVLIMPGRFPEMLHYPSGQSDSGSKSFCGHP